MKRFLPLLLAVAATVGLILYPLVCKRHHPAPPSGITYVGPAPIVFSPHTASYNAIAVDQGATLSLTFTWYQSDGVTPVNLASYTVTFHVQQTAQAGGALLNWSSYCTLGGTAGTVTLTVPATVTTGYSVQNFGQYEIVLTAPDGVTKYRVWRGAVSVNLSVG